MTGHRRFDDTGDGHSLEKSAGTVFDCANQLLAALSADSAFSDEAEPVKCCLSALAEGADRMGAHAALAHGWKLHAVLPFDRAAYRDDFADPDSAADFAKLIESASSITELGGPPEDEAQRLAGYEAAGYVIVRNCDVLIAIWDGKDARGRGGTGDVVAMALRRGVVVAWIDPSEPGIIRVGTDGANWRETRSDQPTELRTAIQDLVAAPPEGSLSRDRLDAFNHEQPVRRAFAIAYDVLLSAFTKRAWPRIRNRYSVPVGDTVDNVWPDFFENTLVASAHKRARRAVTAPYAWADHLSMVYADRYRSSYVLNFLLAALAVFVGLLGLLTSIGHGSPDILPTLGEVSSAASAHHESAEDHGFRLKKYHFVVVELLLIAVIAFLTVAGRRSEWHRKWLDYRQLAEFLRIARLGVIVGYNADPPEADEEDTMPGARWVAWRTRAALREAPIIDGKIDPSALSTIRDRLLDSEIRPQIAYHLGADGQPGNAQRMDMLAHKLERLAQAAFLATGVIGVVYCAVLIFLDTASAPAWLKGAEDLIKYGGSIVMASLPAFGAALSGIVAQGDYEASADNSNSIGIRLRQIERELEADQTSNDYARLLAAIRETASAQIVDLDTWRSLYRRKALNFPA